MSSAKKGKKASGGKRPRKAVQAVATVDDVADFATAEPLEASREVDPFRAKRGRPPKYRAEYARFAAALARTGATDNELAALFQVTPRTIANWQSAHPDFFQAVQIAKDSFDDRIERAFAQRCLGYSYTATKALQFQGQPMFLEYEEHVPADASACLNWLKNRRPTVWRDKQEQENSGQIVIQLTPEDMAY